MWADAKAWLDGALSRQEAVGFVWVVLLAFLRISTRAGIFSRPLTAGEARRTTLTLIGFRVSDGSGQQRSTAARHEQHQSCEQGRNRADEQPCGIVRLNRRRGFVVIRHCYETCVGRRNRPSPLVCTICSYEWSPQCRSTASGVTG